MHHTPTRNILALAAAAFLLIAANGRALAAGRAVPTAKILTLHATSVGAELQNLVTAAAGGPVAVADSGHPINRDSLRHVRDSLHRHMRDSLHTRDSLLHARRDSILHRMRDSLHMRDSVHHAKRDSLMKHMRDSVIHAHRDSLMKHMRDSLHVRDSINHATRDSLMKHLRDSLHVRDSIHHARRDSVLHRMRDSLHVRDSVNHAMRDSLMKRMRDSLHVRDSILHHMRDSLHHRHEAEQDAGDTPGLALTAGDLVPTDVRLEQNYPNPFTASTAIRFTLQADDNVTLAVYAVTGTRVATLVDGPMNAGTHEVRFSGDRLPSGVYWYSLQTSAGRLTQRMFLSK